MYEYYFISAIDHNGFSKKITRDKPIKLDILLDTPGVIRVRPIGYNFAFRYHTIEEFYLDWRIAQSFRTGF